MLTKSCFRMSTKLFGVETLDILILVLILKQLSVEVVLLVNVD